MTFFPLSSSSQLIRFSGVPLGEACTVVIRGATKQILDEADRSLHDALCVLSRTVKETKVVYGGGERENVHVHVNINTHVVVNVYMYVACSCQFVETSWDIRIRLECYREFIVLEKIC